MKKILMVLLGLVFATGMVFAADADILVFRPSVNPRDKKDPMVVAAAQ